jgi:hypothetical protein
MLLSPRPAAGKLVISRPDTGVVRVSAAPLNDSHRGRTGCWRVRRAAYVITLGLAALPQTA